MNVDYKTIAEYISIKRFVTEVYPNGIVSLVSDSFDFWSVIEKIMPKLKDDIMKRDGKVVLRPDSGDPVRIICGDEIVDFTEITDDFEKFKKLAKNHIVNVVEDETPHGEEGEIDVTQIFKYKDKYYSVNVEIEWDRYDKQYYYIDGSSLVSCEEIELTPEQKGAVECLWEVFGGTTTETGHKLLDSHIGLIYGDSITIERATEILKRLEAKGFASGNIVFGVGSYTYQLVTRDSLGFAVKATSGVVNGERRAIFKDPKTDSGTKKSAKGLLKVVDGVLYDNQTEDEEHGGDLKVMFFNGDYFDDNLKNIRERLTISLDNC